MVAPCTARLLTVLSAYQHFSYAYWADTMPHIGNCAGTEQAALFGCGLLSSYLVLFINFYIQTYKKPSRGPKPTANGNGVANGKANGHAYVEQSLPPIRFSNVVL